MRKGKKKGARDARENRVRSRQARPRIRRHIFTGRKHSIGQLLRSSFHGEEENNLGHGAGRAKRGVARRADRARWRLLRKRETRRMSEWRTGNIDRKKGEEVTAGEAGVVFSRKTSELRLRDVCLAPDKKCLVRRGDGRALSHAARSVAEGEKRREKD